MPVIVRERYLNYSKVLVPETIGQILGPDTSGEHWIVSALEERTDGKPGTFMVLIPLSMA